MPKPPAQSAASRAGVLPLLSHPASRARRPSPAVCAREKGKNGGRPAKGGVRGFLPLQCDTSAEAHRHAPVESPDGDARGNCYSVMSAVKYVSPVPLS